MLHLNTLRAFWTASPKPSMHGVAMSTTSGTSHRHTLPGMRPVLNAQRVSSVNSRSPGYINPPDISYSSPSSKHTAPVYQPNIVSCPPRLTAAFTDIDHVLQAPYCPRSWLPRSPCGRHPQREALGQPAFDHHRHRHRARVDPHLGRLVQDRPHPVLQPGREGKRGILAPREQLSLTRDTSCAQASDPAASLLLGLLGIVLDGVDALIGLDCSPITVIGVGSGGSCDANAVCCQNNNVVSLPPFRTS